VAELPFLKELRDIHLPQGVSIWPLAWGFWGVLVLIFLSVGIYCLIKPYYRAFKLRESYLNQLKTLETNLGETTLVEIAILLKRAALLNYPRSEVASLYGEKWLQFLCQTGKILNPTALRILFTQSLYQAPQAENLKPAFKLAYTWLKQQRFRECMN
jgi:hypothetical protein